MANIDLYFPKMIRWEGGYVNDPIDKGGVTKHGVTLGTWQKVGYDKDEDGDIDKDDVKLLTHDDVKRVLRLFYWDKWKADRIINQSQAEQVVDFVWGSGLQGIKIPQRAIGVDDDGKVGNFTLDAINGANQAEIHAKIQKARLAFIDRIIKRDPSQRRFEKGWKNRILSFKFEL